MAAQHRFTARGPVAAAAARAAFAADVFQGPVLLALAVAARPLPVTALVKATAVGGIGVVALFALGRLFVGWTRAGRLL